jgi:hypothetical protein
VNIRGKSRRGVKTSPGISRLEAGRCGVDGGDEWQRSAARGRKGMELTGGPHMAVT